MGVGLLLAVAGSAWILATENRDVRGRITAPPRLQADWPMSAGRAASLREDALRRAAVRVSPPGPPSFDFDVVEPPLTCRFLPSPPSGTSAKFDCVLENGEVVKVKYGRNPEVAAEVAATRLLTALGYAADRMTIAERVHCIGCPRYPFLGMRLLWLAGGLDWPPADGADTGASDFEWAAVERKFAAAPIEALDVKGWAWWELGVSAEGPSREDLDALRLLAVFLGHWDNKAENQRLVCLDAPGGTDERCPRPLAMLQDLGATFGPAKANLAQWRSTPVWSDPSECRVSMEAMPFEGGTFPVTTIGEAGRDQLARQLSAISDDEIRSLFRYARFPQYYSGTNDEKDLDAWTEAFRWRVRQIEAAGPCRLSTS